MKKLLIILFLVIVMSVSAFAQAATVYGEPRSEQDCANKRAAVNNVITSLAQSGNVDKQNIASDILQYTAKCCGGELSPAVMNECKSFYTAKLNLAFMQSNIGLSSSDIINDYALRYCSGYTWGEGALGYNCGCPDCDELTLDARAIANYMKNLQGAGLLNTFGLGISRYIAACCDDTTCSGCSDTTRANAASSIVGLLAESNGGTAVIRGKSMTQQQAAQTLLNYMQCCCECKKITGMAAGAETTPTAQPTTPSAPSYSTDFCAWFDSNANYPEAYIAEFIGHNEINDMGGVAIREAIAQCRAGTYGGNFKFGVESMLWIIAQGDDVYARDARDLLKYLRECCKTAPAAQQPSAQAAAQAAGQAQPAGAPSTAGLLPHQRAAQACRDMQTRLHDALSSASGYDQIMLQALIDCIQRCCDNYATAVEEAYGGEAEPAQAAYYPGTDVTPYAGEEAAYPASVEVPISDSGAIMWDPALQRFVPADVAEGQDVMILRSEVPSAGLAFGLGGTSTLSNIIWVGLAIIAIIVLFLIFRRKK